MNEVIRTDRQRAARRRRERSRRRKMRARHLEVLRASAAVFVGAIDGLGGVEQVASGMLAPLGEPRLYGLGDAYLAACGALGRDPLIDGERRVRRLKF